MAQAARSASRMDRLPREEVDAALARIEMVARMMDSALAIPGTNFRLGFDAVVGLVPILGDLLSQAISTYIIWEARRLGVSNFTLARMVGNSLVDTVFGAVPIVGDAFDVVFRANMKNLRLLQQHLEKHGRRPAGPGQIIEGSYRRVA
jgi:Domain of unknown function (DUF4112)